MKASTKLKIIGFCLIPVGIILIVLGCTVFAYHPFGNSFFGRQPHMGALIPGALLCFISILVLIAGFNPSLTKFGARLHNETMDHAGKDITEAVSKTVDTVTPAITKVVGAVRKGVDPKGEDPQVYCKHCGNSIDEDSKFCKHCAKEQ